MRIYEKWHTLLPENIHPHSTSLSKIPTSTHQLRHPGTTHKALVNEELNDVVQPDCRSEGKTGQPNEVLQVIYKWSTTDIKCSSLRVHLVVSINHYLLLYSSLWINTHQIWDTASGSHGVIIVLSVTSNRIPPPNTNPWSGPMASNDCWDEAASCM